ncbi:MAG: sigma factor-like helix-turn-helix DNA-binding protein [Candidatus Moranbacteria bacterium]|nr:sigma factor-like helix-turn-helix DNA-binding protein [Candidatus Moranbacteria bacterium]
MEEQPVQIILKESGSQKIPVKEITAKSLIEDLLQLLSAKQKLVIGSRFGISGGEPKTLEAIGKNLNITRERVRQIEADAIKALKKTRKSAEFEKLIFDIKEIIREKGGISSRDELSADVFEKFSEKKNFSPDEARGLEIAFFIADLKRNKGNKETIDSWTSPDFDRKLFRDATLALENIFDNSKKLFSPEEILRKLEYSDFKKKYPGATPEQILNFLSVSKKFGKNVFGDWGKARWPLIRPRGVREKATLVLMKKEKPIHFREISRLIEEYGMSQKKVHPQTVHNELIRDQRFVLVGRGTYALREWGYEEGTVKDVIISLIKSAGGFLKRENLVSGVLKKRKVKKATISVNLSDKNVFEKVKDGYTLKAQN